MGGILRLPDEGSGPYPAVVLCHGHSRHKNDGLDLLAQHLGGKGFATFRFDFRGCGGTVGRFNLLPNHNCREDLANAITFLGSEPDVDPKRIGTAGISMGGSLVTQNAADDSRVKCTVAMAPVADLGRNFKNIWKTGLGQDGYDEMLRLLEQDNIQRVRTGLSGFISSARICGMKGDRELEYLYENCREQMEGRMNNNYVTLEGVEDSLELAPERDAHKITVPLLILYGADDDIVDPSESRSLYEKAGSVHKKLVAIEGCDHNIPMNPKRDSVFPQIVEWFQEYL